MIRKEYAIFRKKSLKSLIIDKLPIYVFNILTIHEIFPEAKYIHLIRDGRDVTLSMKKEWSKRSTIVETKNYLGLIRTALNMLKRQPFFRFKLMAIFHECSSIRSLNPAEYLNKSRWNGQTGWGPRFEGWQEYLQTHTNLEFNAMQWVESVEAAKEAWPALPEKNKVEINYEDLLLHPEETLSVVLDFLEVKPTPAFSGHCRN
jgi:hypothetical protein